MASWGMIGSPMQLEHGEQGRAELGKTYVLCSSFVPRIWVLTRGVSQYLQTSKKNFLVAACGINSLLKDQTPGPLHWECRVLAIGPPGKSLKTFLIVTTREVWVPLPCVGRMKLSILNAQGSSLLSCPPKNCPAPTSQVGLVAKNLPVNVGDLRDTGSTPRSGRFPGGGHGNPLQCSCLENLHGQMSLVDYSPWGRKESDTAEAT